MAVFVGAGLAATLGAVLAAIGMLLLLLVPSQGGALLGLTLFTVGIALVVPSVYVMAARQISDKAPALRVLLLIGIYTVTNIGTMFGVTIGGLLIRTQAYPALFLAAMLLMVMAGVLLALAWWGDARTSVAVQPDLEPQRCRQAAAHLGAACLWWWSVVLAMHYTSALVNTETYQRWMFTMPISTTLAAIGIGTVLLVAHFRPKSRFTPTLMVGAALACLVVQLLLVFLVVNPRSAHTAALLLGSYLASGVSEVLLIAAIATMAMLTRSRWDTLVVGSYLLLTGGIGHLVLLPLLRNTSFIETRAPLILPCILIGVLAAFLLAYARRLDLPADGDDNQRPLQAQSSSEASG